MSTATHTVVRQRDACPECAGRVRTNCHVRYCESCGLVTSETAIDTGPEWRGFDAPRRERTGDGLTPTLHDRGLGSTVRFDGGPAANRRQRENERAREGSKRARNLKIGLGELGRVASAVEVPAPTHARASRVWRAVYADDITGTAIEPWAAASLWFACRAHRVPRSPAAIAAATRGCDRQTLLRRFAGVCDTLGDRPRPFTAPEWVPAIVSRVGVGPDGERRAREMVAQADTGTRRPRIVAAAAVYAANCAGLTQRAVADAAGCSTASIRTVRDVLVGGGE